MDHARDWSHSFSNRNKSAHDSQANLQQNKYTQEYLQPHYCAMFSAGALNLPESPAKKQPTLWIDLTW